jgi:hypothetical protein
MKLRPIVLSFIAAGFLTIVFNASVYTEFKRERNIIVNGSLSPSKKGIIRLRLPQLNVEAPGRMLFFALQNRSDRSLAISVRIKKTFIKSFEVPARKAGRFYAPISNAMQGTNSLNLIGREKNWALRSLDIRNFYGFSSLYFRFVLIDRDFPEYTTPSKPASICFFLVILIFSFLFSIPTRASKIWKIYWIPAALISIILVVSLLIPFVSRYRMLIAGGSFVKLVALLYLPSVCCIYRNLKEKRLQIHCFQVPLVVASVFLFFSLCMLYKLREYEGNYSGFLHISHVLLERNPILKDMPEIKDKIRTVGKMGYDGQIFYFVAFDPFLTRFAKSPEAYLSFTDFPAYRYRRIAYPLLAKIFSLNQPEYFPAAMVCLILCAHAISAFFLARIALFYGKSPWWALLCILIPGFTFSLFVATPEALAACFLIAGFYCYLRKQLTWAALLFAFALLTRETTALFVAVLAMFALIKDRDRKTAFLLGCAFIPYTLWRLYVTWRLFPLNGWHGFFFNPPGVSIPFVGIAQVYADIFNGQYPIHSSHAAVYVSLLIFGLLFLGFFAIRRSDISLGTAAFLYSLLALSLHYQHVWKSVENVERLSFESFLCLILTFLAVPQELTDSAPHYGKFRTAVLIFFVFVSVYDLFFMTRFSTFRAPIAMLINS